MAASPESKARGGPTAFLPPQDSFSLWTLAPSKPATKVASEPVAYLPTDHSPLVAGPLKHRFAGRIINASVEATFDRLFRNIGDGSFDADHLLARGCNLQTEGHCPWTNLPPEGSATAQLSCDEGGASALQSILPCRQVEYNRPLRLPNWARMLADFPAACRCQERWTLHGLGQDESFALDVEVQTFGAPFSDAFILKTRYKATVLRSEETQLDAEAEFIWLKSTMLQSRIERAVLEEFQRTFEVNFLPLAAKKLKPVNPPPTPTSPSRDEVRGFMIGGDSAFPSEKEKGGYPSEKTGGYPSEKGAGYPSEKGEGYTSEKSQACSPPGVSEKDGDAGDDKVSFNFPPQLAAQKASDSQELSPQDGKDKASPGGSPPTSETPQQWKRTISPVTPISPANSQALKSINGTTSPKGAPLVRRSGRSRKSTVEFELRVEVLSAANLSSPEYRFGDFTQSLVRKPFQNVYVELEAGDKSQTSGCAVNPEGLSSIEFVRERMLFVYGGERELKVTVLDKRGLQAALRGDPIIGCATCRLDPGIMDGYPRWQDLPLQRSGQKNGDNCGSVQLRFQLLSVQLGGPRSSVKPKAASLAAAAAAAAAARASASPEASQDLDAEYATPNATLAIQSLRANEPRSG
eukprot:CAMPEP_0178425794 /NCGR_PEP_ID=MMETSP0689_2-20121128/28903_1 /TAXON_ID=160604 /ORGANISM="Amphidinium massartii, Strain CS-259" /LENGTH=633 /DNA_ID=CAMNT_0020047461 /DNA_START=33 /DNA_END=1932 /DNA_ORIENTATION=-